MARRVSTSLPRVAGIGLLLSGVSLFQFHGLGGLESGDWIVASGAGLICIGGLLIMAGQMRA